MYDCNVCKRHRKWDKMMEKYEFTKKDRRFLKTIYDDLSQNEDDVEYYKCILYGNWPTGKNILQRALKRYD